VHRGYWIDIGTPDKYLQAHRDILGGRLRVALAGEPLSGGWAHRDAMVEGVEMTGPFYIGPGCQLAAGARIGPGAVLTESVRVATGAEIGDSVVWAGTEIGPGARLDGALIGADVRIGREVRVGPGAVLGEAAVLPDFTRCGQ